MTQSLGFGVPMLYGSDQPHAPEVELAIDGENAVSVSSESVEEWSAEIRRVWAEREVWSARREQISAGCRAKYSIETMARGFAAAIEGR